MLDLTKRGYEISTKISQLFDGEIVQDCLGAAIIALTNQVIVHGKEPETIKYGAEECVKTFLTVVELFIKAHDEDHPVWKKIQEFKEHEENYHASHETVQ